MCDDYDDFLYDDLEYYQTRLRVTMMILLPR